MKHLPDACYGTLLESGCGRRALAAFVCIAGLVLVIWGCLPGVAQAQGIAPSLVTPQDLRPIQPLSSRTGLSIPGGARREAPAGADALNVLVRRVVVEGDFPEFAGTTRALSADIAGKRVSVAQLYEFAGAVEQAYARAGYVLVRVVLPPQKIVDGGDLRVIVVDGFIDAVDVRGVDERVRAIVSRRMEGLVGKHRVKVDEIERHLLIAGDVYGLNLKSTMTRGASDGGTTLVLEGKHRVASGSMSHDNYLPATIGWWQTSTSAALNSPFGQGEQFYLTRNFSFEFQHGATSFPLQIMGLGANVPIGLDGWMINPEYTHSRTQSLPAPGLPTSVGLLTRFTLRSVYAPIRTRSQSLTITSSLEELDQAQLLPILNTESTHDRLGLTRTSMVYDTSFASGTSLTMNVAATQGLGGRDARDVATSKIPLSRQGAGPGFTHFNLDARISQSLAGSFILQLNARGQLAFNKAQLSSEQFQIDGIQSVSGFPSGAIAVDDGMSLRTELARSMSIETGYSPLSLQPYVFTAGGIGTLAQPTAVERAHQWAASLGAGLRGALDERDGFGGITIAIESARLMSNVPSQPSAWRSTISLASHF